MKNLLLFFAFLFSQTFFAQNNQPKETQTLAEAIEFISNYYADFTTEYDYKGDYKMVSNLYKPTFSGSQFMLMYTKYDEANKPSIVTDIIDFKKVTEIQPYGGEFVQVQESEPIQIPISIRIGFRIEDEIKTIKIYVEDTDITVSPIYKAFETVWKYYRK